MNYHKKRNVYLIFAFLWFAAVCFAASSGVDEPTAQQFAEARSIMLDAVEKRGIPSLSVAVARDGQIIWEESFGWADIEKKIKATPNTMYSLASISKPITATGLMVLVERKLVDLDRPANNYLGRAKLKAFNGDAADATVRRLLQHRAGLAIHWNFFYEDDPYPRPDMEESIRRYGILVVPPGVLYTYSNFGYGILEYIIEGQTGKDYRTFIKNEVFLPLDLKRTDVFTSPVTADHIARRYLGKRALPFYDFDHRGASAVYSSAHDLVRFGMFHLKNRLKEQKPVLKDQTIDLMKESTGKAADNYKLGWGVGNRYGLKIVSHSGGMPGVSTVLQLLPEENIVITILCNGGYGHMGRVLDAIQDVMLPDYARARKAAKQPARKPPVRVKTTPAPFLGTWTGEIVTHSGTLPVEMTFSEKAVVTCRLLGENFKDMAPMRPFGLINLDDDDFNGTFPLKIPTEDAARHRHNTQIDLKRFGNRLTGIASAIGYNTRFRLPSYMWLEKKAAEDKD